MKMRSVEKSVQQKSIQLQDIIHRHSRSFCDNAQRFRNVLHRTSIAVIITSQLILK